MKNAHLRIGKMAFHKTVGKSVSNFALQMDRFIGERTAQGASQAHLLSVFGGDAQVAAASAVIYEQEFFSVEGPELAPLHVSMGKDAECYRASIQLSTNKRPLRHLIAVSKEFVQHADFANSGRTLLADADPVYIWTSIAHIFGLPALPQWADWFNDKLQDNMAVNRLFGLGCSPVVVTGTKEEFLRWLSSAVRKGEIQFPEQNGPAVWPSTELAEILLPASDIPSESGLRMS
jgi:hypothetical protein